MHNTPKYAKLAYTLPLLDYDLMRNKGKFLTRVNTTATQG